ncbi:hypothetical protein [Actinoplanes sp. NPDC051411]|uniref:hypothetical protein n=1 Tax=Actinoplanes sp. NPDC051411 TaxID=3155522 RepID=UPI0034137321
MTLISGKLPGTVVLAVAGAAGTSLIVTSYRLAEWQHGSPFPLFWLGLLLFAVPAIAVAGRRDVSPSVRLGVLVGYAAFTYLPKLLRNPDGPLYHDEFAHWRQSQEILTDGRLFETNPIVRVIGDFPGLHATVASIAALAGISVWQAALVVLVLAHVLVVLGVAVLAGDLWGNPRVAAVAAVIYSLNSSFLFFDTQFGYESLAIPLLIWTLVTLLRALRASLRAARLGWSALTLLLAGATIATHHLTALWLIGVMLLVSTVLSVRSFRSVATATAWALTGATAALVAAWLIWVSPRTAGYLDPYFGQALDQAAGMAGKHGSGSRQLFSQSIAPWWERAAAFVAPPIAMLGMGLAVIRLWRDRSGGPVDRSARLSLLILGSLYFPAALLILTPSGAEGARRSWAFSYLGIALVVAPVVGALLNRFRFIAGGLLAVTTVLLVGNVAAGMNPSYRFPGPPAFGSDTRAASPEMLAASAWLRRTQGRDLRIVADRYSGLIFGSYGGQDPVTGSGTFPTYDLYLAEPGRPISAPLLSQLQSWRFGYLVVDRRMALEVPDIKIYFETNEPIPHGDRPAFTLAQLTKFDSLPWTIKIYDSSDVAIYRFDFGSLRASASGGTP